MLNIEYATRKMDIIVEMENLKPGYRLRCWLGSCLHACPPPSKFIEGTVPSKPTREYTIIIQAQGQLHMTIKYDKRVIEYALKPFPTGIVP
jgi:hypothetical protein